MASLQLSPAQREAADQARRETVEQLHQRLSDNIASLDNLQAWQQWLGLASKLHRYSFNNVMLIMLQKPEATVVAGYRAWQALGHQVRRGERAIKILGPVTRKVELVDRSTGEPIREANGEPRCARQLVGVKPVSVFDASQVDPPVPTPPEPQLLEGQAPPGLWDALAGLVAAEDFTLTRGDCRGANGYTDYAAHEVRVRADVDDAQAVKTLAHELGHVLLPPAPGEPLFGPCRGRREVEAESVAYMVTQAHGLDAGQYTFNYVAGWATEAAGPGESIEAVVAETGSRVITAVDQILQHTSPADLETQMIDAVANDLAVGPSAVGPAPHPPMGGEMSVWEQVVAEPGWERRQERVRVAAMDSPEGAAPSW